MMPRQNDPNDSEAKFDASGKRIPAGVLLQSLYEELRELATARFARLRPGQTLQPTALVHEAYIRLAGKGDPGWDDKRHFFGAAAQAMRQILIEQARRKGAAKHGGGRERISLDTVDVGGEPTREDVLDLDAVIGKLESYDPRKARIAALRIFAGMSARDAAELLDISITTMKREWQFIRVWLHAELSERRLEDG